MTNRRVVLITGASAVAVIARFEPTMLVFPIVGTTLCHCGKIHKWWRCQMIIKHDGATPRVDPAAWVAPNAVICGDVTIGPRCRVMFGAQVIAEGGSISIGRECIIMENAVLRSSARH